MVGSIEINRAPVMTLWAVVVAERLGYDPEAALSLGKSVAGLNAQAKGRRLGLFEESIEEDLKKREPKARAPGEQLSVELLGRLVPAVQTGHDLVFLARKPIHASTGDELYQAVRGLLRRSGLLKPSHDS